MNRIKNSYIFLLRDEANFSINFLKLLKNNLNFVDDYKDPDKLMKLSDVDPSKYEKILYGTDFGTIDINDEIECNVKLVKATSTQYLDIEIIGKKEVELINEMQKIHDKINSQNGDFVNNYIVITSYDSISEYYCKKIYKVLGEFERKFRKLLFNVYTSSFKKTYFEETTSIEMQDKAKSKIKSKNKDIRLQNYLYSLDFGMMHELLFEEKWLKFEEETKKELLDKNKDLLKLSNEELKAKISDIKPKSDWERLFNDKGFNINFDKTINEIGGLRNSVAHNKIFTKSDYIKLNNLLKSSIKTIDKAIVITEDVDFKRLNEEKFNEDLMRIGEILYNSFDALGETIRKINQTLFNLNLNGIFANIDKEK